MYRARIRVTLRPSILDPQGKAVQQAIASLGIGGVGEVRMGKYIELSVDAPDADSARRTTEEVCRKLLANPVMEDAHIDVEKG
jgi:phosphoribosylformylglycinamidine synthase subunit PurS